MVENVRKMTRKSAEIEAERSGKRGEKVKLYDDFSGYFGLEDGFFG